MSEWSLEAVLGRQTAACEDPLLSRDLFNVSIVVD